MLDKNGREMVTGDVVLIRNAYFKNDNGLWFIDRSPGDPSWSGRDYSLKKLLKNGKISTAKRNICFWPIGVFINDPWKKADAKEHNRKYATIEVVDGIDRSEIAAHFRGEAAGYEESLRRACWDFGKDSEDAKRYRGYRDYLTAVANRITA